MNEKMKKKYGLNEVIYEKRNIIIKFFAFIFALCCIGFFLFFSVTFIRDVFFDTDLMKSLYTDWKMNTQEGYEKVYKNATVILKKRPFNSKARAFLGYSSFMLSQSCLDSITSQKFIDESIFSLRRAGWTAPASLLPQIQYMLGRAYFYKNKNSSYNCYSDLVVKYLTSALELGYKSNDINLFLGLSYADLEMHDESIKSFAEALKDGESDILLFNIAEQYCLNGQENPAKQYVVRVINTSQNEDLINESHILLGRILINEDTLDEAEKEFKTVIGSSLTLDKNPSVTTVRSDLLADAYFELGRIYEKRGDRVKARSEWRTCLRIKPNHSGALAKLSMNSGV